jgi:hypothetical protein
MSPFGCAPRRALHSDCYTLGQAGPFVCDGAVSRLMQFGRHVQSSVPNHVIGTEHEMRRSLAAPKSFWKICFRLVLEHESVATTTGTRLSTKPCGRNSRKELSCCCDRRSVGLSILVSDQIFLLPFLCRTIALLFGLGRPL